VRASDGDRFKLVVCVRLVPGDIINFAGDLLTVTSVRKHSWRRGTIELTAYGTTADGQQRRVDTYFDSGHKFRVLE
jgi:hypothetical protein